MNRRSEDFSNGQNVHLREKRVISTREKWNGTYQTQFQQQAKINGEIVKAEMKAAGAPKGNINAKKQLDESHPIVSDSKPKTTVERMAKELNGYIGTNKQ